MESACRPWEILQPQQRNPTKARTSLSANTICLIVGVLIGFMASTFLSMFVSCPEYSQESVQSLVVPSLPRAQATDQHRRTTGATTAGMHPPSVSSSDATNDDPDDVGWSLGLQRADGRFDFPAAGVEFEGCFRGRLIGGHRPEFGEQ